MVSSIVVPGLGRISQEEVLPREASTSSVPIMPRIMGTKHGHETREAHRRVTLLTSGHR